MLQTIYEGESRFSSDSLWGILDGRAQSHLVGPVDVKPEAVAIPEPVSPLDLRTEGRMLALGGDSDAWERRLQQELLLIQRQQQIQKQLLICEFQKQHERLIRQHQAQLQEHLKLQQELLAMKQQQQQQQQQETLEKERKMEEGSPGLDEAQEPRQEQQRREKNLFILRSKERTRESAVASTEVKQRLQDFLLNKPAKELNSSGPGLSVHHQAGLWYTSTQTMAADQNSPGLGKVSPSYKYPLPSLQDGKDSFPLRKTASEPNLKLRCRLKQKVAERRSSPLMRRKDCGMLMAPYKKRVLELTGSSASSSAPGSGPSSPNETSSTPGTESGTSSLPCTVQTELSQRILKADDSMALLNLYTSPSLPNITLGLPPAPSPVRAATALKEKSGDTGSGGSGRQVLPAHFLGAMPPVALETKVNSSHQALLQHLLLKEQMRQQKIIPAGVGGIPGLPQSPLAMRDRPASSMRPKLPRHRPLNRTQSAPLPQSTLAQLVIQQQHQNFVEKQKQYQQQVHINQMLSQSIEQLRHPSTHLQEEEEDIKEQSMWDTLPPGGVIRKHSRCSSTCSSDGEVPSGAHLGAVKVKEEPPDSEEEGQVQQGRSAGRSAHLQQVGGDDTPQRMVIRAIM